MHSPRTSVLHRAAVRIPRPALVARVGDAIEGRSLVVVAPAGYGKTALIEQAFAETDRRSAWIRATPADCHAGRLLDSLARAFHDAAPGSSEVVAGAGDGVHNSPPTEGTRALLAECDQLLIEPVTIVIDDAEVLIGSEGACSVLDELIRGAGPKVGVVVLSRRSLPLRLRKLVGTGQLVELGTVDLAFDAAECSDLVTATTGRSATAAEVADLMAATEGWPLGIATLVQDGGFERDAVDRPLRSTGALRDYLREEVLAPLAESERRALLSSAVPRQLTPAVAAALDLPEEHLAGAGTRGMFLHRQSADTDTFAYHPLFREVLLDELVAAFSPDEVRAVHRRVAPAVADDDAVEAIEHWIAAEQWRAAIEAIDARAQAMVPMSPTLVGSWLDRLPDGFRTDARVQLLAGHLAWVAGDYTDAIGHLRAGLGLVTTGADRHGGPGLDAPVGTVDTVSTVSEWWGRFLLIDCLGLVGDPEDGVAIAEGFDGPDAGEAGPVAAAAGLYAAHGLASAGRSGGAFELAARVNGMADAAAVLPIDALMRAYIDVPAGNLADSADRTLGALRRVEVDDPLGMRLNLMAAHATVLAEQGHRDQALEWWEAQRVEADRALMVARVNTIRGLQAMLLAQMGRLADAEDHLAVHDATDTWADQPSHVAGALIAAGRGDRTATFAAARLAFSKARTAPPLWRWWTWIDVVPALVAVGALDRAEAALEEAAALVEATYPGESGRHLRARTATLGAFVAAEQGDLARAFTLLEAGLGRTVPTAPEILRLEWVRIESVVAAALGDGVLDPAATVAALWTAFPDGRALVRLADHPEAAVRTAAFRPALASGHPTARSIVAGAADDPDPTVVAAAQDAIARVAEAAPPRRFESLGGFRVRRGGWTTDERSWGRPVDARLCRFLVVHGETPVPVDVIFEALWPELDVDGARRSLQVAASRIRQLLDDPGTSMSIIGSGHGTYRLRLGAGDVLDWQEFEHAADVALREAEPSLGLLERAHSLWGGDPLPEERYADWAAGWRTRLVDRCVEVLVALVAAHERNRDEAGAIRIARELVDLDPYDERSHRLLMAALARAGRRGKALRQYLVCRRMLLDDLGVEPSDATTALHDDILAGRPI